MIERLRIRKAKAVVAISWTDSAFIELRLDFTISNFSANNVSQLLDTCRHYIHGTMLPTAVA